MRAIILSLGLLGAATGAQAFDAKQCTRIVDVDLPYEVSTTDAAIRFHGTDGDIIVTPTAITRGARTYSGSLAGGYYGKMRQFLAQASTMARTANPLGGFSGLGSAATDMCQAILELDASDKAVEHDFQDFASPVRIVLR